MLSYIFPIFLPSFLQSGVSEVIYFIQKNNSDMAYTASHKLLSMAGIKVSFACCFVEAPTEVYFGHSTLFDTSNCVLAGTDNQSMTPSLPCHGNTCPKLFTVHINKYLNPTWICSSFGISLHLTFLNLFLIRTCTSNGSSENINPRRTEFRSSSKSPR